MELLATVLFFALRGFLLLLLVATIASLFWILSKES